MKWKQYFLFYLPSHWFFGGLVEWRVAKSKKNAEGHFLVALGVSVSLSILGSSDYILIV